MEDPMDTRPVPPCTSSAQIRIDISSLKEFGILIRNELDRNISPAFSRAERAISAGDSVASQLPSDDIQLMNRQYAICSTAMLQQLHALQAALTILGDAAFIVAERYKSSDALAQSTISGVTPDLLKIIASHPLSE
jgi:hypothetical protein